MRERTAYDKRYIDHEGEEEGHYLGVYFSLMQYFMVTEACIEGVKEENEQIREEGNSVKHGIIMLRG